MPTEVYSVASGKGTEKPVAGNFINIVRSALTIVQYVEILFSDEVKNSIVPVTGPVSLKLSVKTSFYHCDNSFSIRRTEEECGRCHSHSGLIFEDGPPPTVYDIVLIQ